MPVILPTVLCAIGQAAEHLEAHAEPPSSFTVCFPPLLGFYGLLVLLTAFAVFVGAVAVVAFVRRPSVVAAYLVFLPLPLLIGVFAYFKGLMSMYAVIALSDAALNPAELAVGHSESLVMIVSGMLATFPSYLVLAFGLLFKTIYYNGAELATARRE